MTVQDAYNAFLEADNQWSAALQATFGKRAGDVRYTELGHTHPACRATYEQFKVAGEQWRTLISLRRAST